MYYAPKCARKLCFMHDGVACDALSEIVYPMRHFAMVRRAHGWFHCSLIVAVYTAMTITMALLGGGMVESLEARGRFPSRVVFSKIVRYMFKLIDSKTTYMDIEFLKVERVYKMFWKRNIYNKIQIHVQCVILISRDLFWKPYKLCIMYIFIFWLFLWII